MGPPKFKIGKTVWHTSTAIMIGHRVDPTTAVKAVTRIKISAIFKVLWAVTMNYIVSWDMTKLLRLNYVTCLPLLGMEAQTPSLPAGRQYTNNCTRGLQKTAYRTGEFINFCMRLTLMVGRDSSVGIATRYELDGG